MQIKLSTGWSRMVLFGAWCCLTGMLGLAAARCGVELSARVWWEFWSCGVTISFHGTSGGVCPATELSHPCSWASLEIFQRQMLKKNQTKTKTQNPTSSRKKANLRIRQKFPSTTQNSWRWMFWSDCCCFTAVVSSSGSWNIFVKWNHEAGPCGRAQ